MAIKNRKPEPPPAEPEPELTWQERRDERNNYLNFYPRIKKGMKTRDWMPTLQAAMGIGHPSRVPQKARGLVGRSLTEAIREVLYQDNLCLMPPADTEELVRVFAHAVSERVRGGEIGSLIGGTGAFANLLGQVVQEGYREVFDSLDGIMGNREFVNYHPSPIAQVLDLSTLKVLGKGQTADVGQLEIVSFGTWQGYVYAAKFVVDEHMLIDDVPGLIPQNLAQRGRAARRCFSDLAWATILSNPRTNTIDGNPLFSTANGNYSATAVLSDVNLGAAVAAIQSQVVTGTGDGSMVIHINLKPKYLIVPPALEYTAREILRLRMLGDSNDNLQLRVESRLGPAGVRHPLTGTVYTGSNTNWLVSCGSESPWILRGTMQGVSGPKLRMSETRPGSGQYGLVCDVSQALAVACTDHRPVYFSVG
jgi:hypothetical protein